MDLETDAAVAAQLLAYVERTSDLVGVVDETSRVVYLNEAARKKLGVGDATELTTADMFPPPVFARYYDEIRPALLRAGTWSGELPVVAAGGETTTMSFTIVAAVGAGGEINGLVTHGRELARDRTGDDFAHDELTGLPRRAILDDRVRVALAHTARGDGLIALAVVNVDAMKEINDSFGHAVGDDVLRGLARAMARTVRAGDTVARIVGDEFVILFNDIDGTEGALQLAERVREAVCRVPLATSGGEIAVTASFGLVVGGAAESPEELLQRADAAMHRAKSLGGGHVVAFDGDAEISLTTLADEFAIAVSHGLIRPHVQTIVDLATGELVGYQGLARWEHPQRGLLSAHEFIDVVANTPIAPVVDLAVLRRTAAAAARAGRRGGRVRAYGHLSRRLMGDIDIERYVAETADDLSLQPADLWVEVAHPLVARHSPAVATALRSLRDVGVGIVLSAVDGECDVNDLVDYGFDEMRLSHRLVRDAATDPARRRVAHGAIALARAVGLRVIAVGIETEAQRADLIEAGCDLGQGYLFSPVVPAGDVD